MPMADNATTASPKPTAAGAAGVTDGAQTVPAEAATRSVEPPNAALVAAAKDHSKTGCSECRVIVESPTNSKHSAFDAFLPSLMSGVLVIAGWFVVNKAQANRERRKQIREFVAALIKDLVELEKSIIDYHTNQRNAPAEQAIISRLTRFEKSCGLLPQFVANQLFLKATTAKSLIVSPLVVQRMRKAMTLKHFSDEHDGSINCTDPLIQEIEIATNEVQEALESVRLASLD